MQILCATRLLSRSFHTILCEESHEAGATYQPRCGGASLELLLLSHKNILAAKLEQSLVPAGYFTRFSALQDLIQRFLKTPGQLQILSLGAGYDTTWFRLMVGDLVPTAISRNSAHLHATHNLPDCGFCLPLMRQELRLCYYCPISLLLCMQDSGTAPAHYFEIDFAEAGDLCS